MSHPQLYVVCVVESIRHTLSIEAASIEEARALLSDPNNPRITPVGKTALALRITDIRPLHPDSDQSLDSALVGRHKGA